ncbi:hypothetical protein K438DRAFT_645274 [Mycena galopus ATCC 62051]|nr:hypothetical protein K438DRAFT_645274 [Mycena galopus ATCC 62051]
MFHFTAAFRRLLAFFMPRCFGRPFPAATTQRTQFSHISTTFNDSYEGKGYLGNEHHIWLPHLLDRNLKSVTEDDDTDDEVPNLHLYLERYSDHSFPRCLLSSRCGPCLASCNYLSTKYSCTTDVPNITSTPTHFLVY